MKRDLKESVAQIISEQVPALKIIQLKELSANGVMNSLYLLNEKYVVRLPKTSQAAAQLDRELRAESLKTKIPEIIFPQLVFEGSSCSIFPFKWAIYEFIQGYTSWYPSEIEVDSLIGPLSKFLLKARNVLSEKDLKPSKSNYFRGCSLKRRDEDTRMFIDGFEFRRNKGKLLNIWENALKIEDAEFIPSMVHGDLHPGNILFENKKFKAIIDFGCVSLGDPSCDLMALWTFFEGESREKILKCMDISENEYLKGKAWALTFALGAIAEYPQTKVGEVGRKTLERLVIGSALG